jgi:hypothetical protein
MRREIRIVFKILDSNLARIPAFQLENLRSFSQSFHVSSSSTQVATENLIPLLYMRDHPGI